MKILFYSSPYDYYLQNLLPVAKLSFEKGYDVICASSNKHTNDIHDADIQYHYGKDNSVKSFLKGKLNIDCVVLAQPWWYVDNHIAEYSYRNKIPFYIIDHAAPMIAYTENEKRLSHLYRKDLHGAKAFFAYGAVTEKIMKKRGCKEKIIKIGSPRIYEQELEARKFKNKYVKEKNIAVVYDTSSRMEDPKVKDIFLKARKKIQDGTWKFLIRKHSRSPGLFDSLIKEYSDIELSILSESELAAIADLGMFTFPSSAMILLAKLGIKMESLYDNHFCLEARDFSKKYKDTFLSAKYSNFLDENLFEHEHNDKSAEKIIKYIIRDLK